MLSFILLTFLLACANAATLPEVKIIGGTPADINDAPWQVAILRLGTDNNYNHVCGGVIITASSILTAAQCTTGIQASFFRIRSGSTFHHVGGQVTAVIRKKEHDAFNSNTYQNDLAFLYLYNDINFGVSAAPAFLPPLGLVVPDRSYCFVTGWGTTSVGGSKPLQLNKVTVPSVNQDRCVSAYSNILAVTPNMICAGNLDAGGVDACVGDTGGPLTISNILIGITSWGVSCGVADYPGVYTRVPMYRNWIDLNLGN